MSTSQGATPKRAAQPYYPLSRDFGLEAGVSDKAAAAGAGALCGFKVGADFEANSPGFDRLAELSFEAPGRRTRGVHQQYALKRIVDGEEPSAAMFIEFDAKGVLIKSALAFTGEPCDTRAIARASAEKIRDFMISRMGPASVSFDRIGDWSKGPMKSVMPEVAFTAAWVSDYFDLRVAKASKASPRPADAVGPAPTAVQLASAYTEAINAFNGRLVTVNVSSANNPVVALVSVIPSA